MSLIAKAAEGVSAQPWAGDAIVAVALGLGILLWLVGRRFVKPLFVLLFTATGGVVGYLGPAALAINVNQTILLAVGLVAGALIGVLLFRFALATAVGVLLAFVAPVVASILLNITPPSLTTGDTPPLTSQEMLLDDVPIETDASENARTGSENGVEPAMLTTEEVAQEAQARLDAFLRQLSVEAQEEWEGLAPREQRILVLSSLSGGLLGLLLGLMWPKHLAAAAAAFVGAATWLPAGALLIGAHNLPGAGLLPSSAKMWLVLWLAVAIVGVILQWTALKPRADKPSS